MTQSNHPATGRQDFMSSDCSFQQHLEDVGRGVQLVQDVRGVQLAQVVQGVQVVLVVQTYQHLEDVVRGVQAKLCKLDNTLKTLCKVLNFQMDLNNHSIFLVNFCIFIKLFNLVVLFQE